MSATLLIWFVISAFPIMWTFIIPYHISFYILNYYIYLSLHIQIFFFFFSIYCFPSHEFKPHTFENHKHFYASNFYSKKILRGMNFLLIIYINIFFLDSEIFLIGHMMAFIFVVICLSNEGNLFSLSFCNTYDRRIVFVPLLSMWAPVSST